MQYRQGDVLVSRIETIPTTAVQQQIKGSVVLADGELTGHAHRIKKHTNRIKHYLDGEVAYLEVGAPTLVEHEEHGPITLEPGCYEVRRQIEVWMDEVRQVAD